jgi:hypothetical protein
MKRNALNIRLLLAGVIALSGVARAQYCDYDDDEDCYNYIVAGEGPFCSGTFGGFTCGENGGGFASYSYFYSLTSAECYDNYYGYYWNPVAGAQVSNPYQCQMNVMLIGGVYNPGAEGPWNDVEGVQSAVYTANSNSIWQEDCAYNYQGYYGTDNCQQNALLLVEEEAAPA